MEEKRCHRIMLCRQSHLISHNSFDLDTLAAFADADRGGPTATSRHDEVSAQPARVRGPLPNFLRFLTQLALISHNMIVHFAPS
jgi:hypothetical protein